MRNSEFGVQSNMNIRSGVKTVVMGILFSLVSFVLLSQAIEHNITHKGLMEAAGHYFGVGSVEISPPNTPINANPGFPYHLTLDGSASEQYALLSHEQINAIVSMPYITSADMRYMTAGVSDEYNRMDDGDWFFNYTARAIIEATVYSEPIANMSDQARFAVSDVKVLAGNPLGIYDGVNTVLRGNTVIKQTGYGSAIGRNRVYYIYNANQSHGAEEINELTVGSRYAFVLRYEPRVEYSQIIGDHLSDSWCSAIWNLDGEPDDYLETERFKPLSTLVEITNADNRKFDIVYTEDMSAIPRFSDGRMAIVNGRALTEEDSENKSTLCVVSIEFANRNHMSIGDMITMNLGNTLFEQYANLGAVASTPGRYAEPVISMALEVVGIYSNTDGGRGMAQDPHMSYSINTIFVPRSLLPISDEALANHKFAPGEFSFKVGNAWDIGAFLDETVPLIDALGMTLFFSDSGWLEISDGYQDAMRLSYIKIGAYLLAVVAITILSGYLYISRKAKEYAIMRALGAERKLAAKALLIPLMRVAAISVLIGSGLSWVYVARTIGSKVALLFVGMNEFDVAVPIWLIIACVGGSLLLTFSFAAALLRHIGKIPPLLLLHGNEQAGVSKGKNVVKITFSGKADVNTINDLRNNTIPQIHELILKGRDSTGATGTYHPIAPLSSSYFNQTIRRITFLLRHVCTHINRTVVKSTLLVVMAVLLVYATGQLASIKQSFADLVSDTEITGYFTGGLRYSILGDILESKYVGEHYYEAMQNVEIITQGLSGESLINSIHSSNPESFVLTNDISRFTGEDIRIDFADGYDLSCMERFDDIVILGETLANAYELEPGDYIAVAPELTQRLILETIRRLNGARTQDNDISDDELLALYAAQYENTLSQNSHVFKVAGIMHSDHSEYGYYAFSPGPSEFVMLYPPLDVVEFTLADNMLSEECKDFFESYAGGTVSFIMDTSTLDTVRSSYDLIDMMYPMAVAGAMLIGGFFSCLVIISQSKDVAIMRVLGTTKSRTRAFLVTTQCALCFMGIAIGVSMMLVVRKLVVDAVFEQIMIFVMQYFAMMLSCGIVCSMFVTMRPPLELLQVRE